MTKAEFAQVESTYAEKASGYRKKLGSEFWPEKLLATIGNENSYYYELVQLIRLGFIQKIAKNKKTLLKITTNPLARINNINVTMLPFRETLKEATDEISLSEDIKKFISLTKANTHKETGN